MSPTTTPQLEDMSAALDAAFNDQKWRNFFIGAGFMAAVAVGLWLIPDPAQKRGAKGQQPQNHPPPGTMRDERTVIV